ncbi:MAG: TIGR04423 family type III CRISPR-associated protein [Bacteroidaceae bacterium]|nr:TIGR04423 family type III CRISPR-associated protein [Bacteroidaceae bacterium]
MKIDKIPEAVYEGYYWMSDKDKPTTLNSKSFSDQLDASTNPFIIEAQLYDEKTRTSISVRYVDGESDGKYVANSYQLPEDISTDEYTEQVYIAHRLEGVSRLRFYRHWVADPDGLCEGMEVLKPKELIFAGFAGKEDKQ